MKRLILLLAVLLTVTPALAHNVSLFAYVEGGKIFTESYFPDGRAVEGGKVLVYDSSDTLLLDGITNQVGFFNFPIPTVDDLKIVIDATMGHKNDFMLKRSEVEAGQ